ncbi:MAG: holo-ACP synthase [Candidatus Marinimicrobia bacterium]|jgi:holo-[acyl-carrier protein] synthase|nr:holo-ACP synthase [Candidatus Neomarinimicrobiota bacterium]MBT3634454.1 holo-ACP synthase [Candidatus Neomarinimicrobiota bacterium]MBT3683281.1 holo-ACP synthase [Candidatus Neomarinimicrobiota bacterium]MBT3760169.1 holo-ACP synthase [Candidatus Neomarinimicrobiota bacterium]MBT3896264.1 holo-ACP synthase [Candidatus Neomarinimicrobiota bacterium]
MIYVGNDIVKVSRIHDLITKYKNRALSHIFTSVEVEYCESKIHPEIHYSGRFAAKEAIKKAILSYNPKLNMPLANIEIEPVKDSAPKVNLLMEDNNIAYLNVSISHTDEYATAVAILELK